MSDAARVAFVASLRDLTPEQRACEVAALRRELVELGVEERDIAMRNAEHFTALGWAEAAMWLRKPEAFEALRARLFITNTALEAIAQALEAIAQRVVGRPSS